MEKQREIVVACGLPFAGQEDLAEQLKKRGWHREALNDQMREVSQESHIHHMAKLKWSDNMQTMGYNAMAALCEPTTEALHHHVIDEAIKYCARNIRYRLDKTDLRTIIDFNGSSREDRENLLASLQLTNKQVTAVHMDTSPEVCAQRAQHAQENGDESAKNFDPESIRQATFQAIRENEGFGEIIRITGDDEGLVTLEEAGIDTQKHLLDWFKKVLYF